MVENYVASAAAWLVAIFAGAVAWRTLAMVRRLRKTGIVPISQMQNGFVKFNGRIYPLDQTLTSPVARNPCVWYRFTVRESRGRRWRLVIDTQAAESVVRDGSGEVHVVPDYGSLNLKPDFHRAYGTLNKLEPSAAEFLSTTYGFQRRYWSALFCHETALEVGTDVFVFGKLAIETDGRRRLATKGTIISDKGEEAVVRGLTWTARLMAAVGAAIALYGTVALFLPKTL